MPKTRLLEFRAVFADSQRALLTARSAAAGQITPQAAKTARAG